MTLGVISDIHGNHMALAAVLDEFRRQKVNELLFLGDLYGYYPFVNECIAMLAEFQVTSVRGNHDEAALECLNNGSRSSERYRKAYGSALDRSIEVINPAAEAFLRALPLKRHLVIHNRLLQLCHGSPWDPLEGRVYPDFKEWSRFEELEAGALLLGHTHYPLNRNCGPVLVLNPGSVGQARNRSGKACAALLDVPSMTANLLEIPYDTGPLIADAREHDPHLHYLIQVLQR